MNTEFTIHGVCVLRVGEETLTEARAALPPDFPRRSARRMTHLGTLMARVMNDRTPGSTLIYGSTYAETRSLEDYLNSFPDPSPLLFQGSIHPSGMQQVYVHRKTPVGTFLPITGSRHLVASLLETALLADKGRVTVCGGEERGTWMLEQDKASAAAFGWAFDLEPGRHPGDGWLSIEAEGRTRLAEPVEHERFMDALESRTPLEIWRPRGGAIHLRWK